jgi:NAD(P)-dependent dehydrogenase (short-subunit alcohol dehydrogenase family)
MPKLQGKVALVTGGSSGIGLATAKRFVEEGAFVYITGRRQTELDKAVSLIGRSVAAVQGDVSNLADLDRLYAKIAREKGKIDILFAGAGIVDPQPLAETTEESFDKVFAINTRGLAFTVKKALPLLNDGGHRYYLDRREQGHPRLHRLQRQQGSSPLLRPHMDGGVEGSSPPGQCDQPGPDRHADL